MAARKLDKARWQEFCDRISKSLVGKRAEIEIASLELGAQVAAEYLPLLGIVYDPKDDLIEIALEGFDHLIHRPRELYFEDGDGGLASLEIVDAEGVRQIVQLRDPLMLPPPASSSGEKRER